MTKCFSYHQNPRIPHDFIGHGFDQDLFLNLLDNLIASERLNSKILIMMNSSLEIHFSEKYLSGNIDFVFLGSECPKHFLASSNVKVIDERDIDQIQKQYTIIIVLGCLHLTVDPELLVFILAGKLLSMGQLLFLLIPNESKVRRNFKNTLNTFYRDWFFPLSFHSFDRIHAIDDPLLIGALLRFRAHGFEAFLTPCLMPDKQIFCDDLIVKKVFEAT